ncbi:hypothetical protein [Legionella waltersii]|uniref:Uncharacterized protein n=1 Tax=Legionella waltersii TaxID=66969 RepID=A0A0W1APE7_9GAMM|nr:hypothetical protein [Legionella waltersii]KTD83120.1 hypothetical protein Lwal_0028 [Legionella waltersii]SNU96776.1 Uncharacterised protein [Legionella waltersii]
MTKPHLTVNIDKAKQYIFDANAFTHFSFYPQEYLNSTSVGLLKKNNWRNNRYVEKPAINLDELVHEGMSKKQAELCLYLLENRKLFCCATAFGDDRVWEERAISKWRSNDFIDRYYGLAQFVFEGPMHQKDKLKKLVDDLREMQEKHIPEQSRGYDFKKSIDDLSTLVSEVPGIDQVKEHFSENQKLLKIINRLEVGANSYNPRWMNSSKKLNRIIHALVKAIDNDLDVDTLLKDKNSELSKAIDMKRITGFFVDSKEKPTHSRTIAMTSFPQM